MSFVMRWFWRGLLTLAVLFSLLAGAIFVYDRIERADIESFYNAHPMLRAMETAPHEKQNRNDTAPQMTAVLLQRIPFGTSRTEALQVLTAERLVCETPAGLAQKSMLVCRPDTRPAIVSRYYIELTFDPSDKVVGGRAFPLKATMP